MGFYDNNYPYQIEIINADNQIIERVETEDWDDVKFSQFAKRYLSSVNYKFVGSYKGFCTLDMTSYTTNKPINLKELLVSSEA